MPLPPYIHRPKDQPRHSRRPRSLPDRLLFKCSAPPPLPRLASTSHPRCSTSSASAASDRDHHPPVGLALQPVRGRKRRRHPSPRRTLHPARVYRRRDQTRPSARSAASSLPAPPQRAHSSTAPRSINRRLRASRPCPPPPSLGGPHLISPGYRFPHRQRPPHQLPPSAVHAAYACQRLRGRKKCSPPTPTPSANATASSLRRLHADPLSKQVSPPTR